MVVHRGRRGSSRASAFGRRSRRCGGGTASCRDRDGAYTSSSHVDVKHVEFQPNPISSLVLSLSTQHRALDAGTVKMRQKEKKKPRLKTKQRVGRLSPDSLLGSSCLPELHLSHIFTSVENQRTCILPSTYCEEYFYFACQNPPFLALSFHIYICMYTHVCVCVCGRG